jgi:hypothetical protein
MKIAIFITTLMVACGSWLNLGAAVDLNSREMKALAKAVEKLRDAARGSKVAFQGAESTAKIKLKAAQKKNTGPEIDKLAAEITEITNKYWGGVQADLDTQRAGAKSDNEFNTLMKSIVAFPRNFWIDCRTPEGRAKAKASRQEFQQRVEQAAHDSFKDYFTGGAGRETTDFTKVLDKETKKILTELPGYKKALIEGQDVSAYSNYHAMLAWQVYLQAAARLYPGKPQYANALAKVNAEIVAVGSEENFEARFRSNSKSFAAKIKMPASRNSDPYVIQEVRNAFVNGGFTAEILKIHVLTTGWAIRRNKYTSVIEGRTQEASIATRTSIGECLLYRVVIHQQYDGANYGNTTFERFANLEMLCSNVPQ